MEGSRKEKLSFLMWLSLHVFNAPKTEKAVVSPSKILKSAICLYLVCFCFFIRLVLFFCLFPIREIHRHLKQLREYRPDFNLRNIFVSQDVDLLRVIRTTLRKSLSLHCNFVSKQIVTIQTGGNSFGDRSEEAAGCLRER